LFYPDLPTDEQTGLTGRQTDMTKLFAILRARLKIEKQKMKGINILSESLPLHLGKKKCMSTESEGVLLSPCIYILLSCVTFLRIVHTIVNKYRRELRGLQL